MGGSHGGGLTLKKIFGWKQINNGRQAYYSLLKWRYIAVRKGNKSLSNEKEFIRLSVRISKDVNDWLDSKSTRSGVPKSTLIYLAIDQYMKQDAALVQMPELISELKRLVKE